VSVELLSLQTPMLLGRWQNSIHFTVAPSVPNNLPLGTRLRWSYSEKMGRINKKLCLSVCELQCRTHMLVHTYFWRHLAVINVMLCVNVLCGVVIALTITFGSLYQDDVEITPKNVTGILAAATLFNLVCLHLRWRSFKLNLLFVLCSIC